MSTSPGPEVLRLGVNQEPLGERLGGEWWTHRLPGPRKAEFKEEGTFHLQPPSATFLPICTQQSVTQYEVQSLLGPSLSSPIPPSLSPPPHPPPFPLPEQRRLFKSL